MLETALKTEKGTSEQFRSKITPYTLCAIFVQSNFEAYSPQDYKNFSLLDLKTEKLITFGFIVLITFTIYYKRVLYGTLAQI